MHRYLYSNFVFKILRTKLIPTYNEIKNVDMFFHICIYF